MVSGGVRENIGRYNWKIACIKHSLRKYKGDIGEIKMITRYIDDYVDSMTLHNVIHHICQQNCGKIITLITFTSLLSSRYTLVFPAITISSY